MFLYAGAFAASAVILLFASKIVSTQVVAIARRLSVPPFFISMLLVAFSTSIPELFVGISSAIHGEPSFSLGNIFGANIVNLTFVAGLVVMLGRKNISLSDHLNANRLTLSFLVASAPVPLLMWNHDLSRLDGAILLFIYAVYVALFIRNRPHTHAKKNRTNAKLPRSIFFFVLGMGALVLASQIIIATGESVSMHFDVAPFVVGVFAIAFSTTLPELTFGIRVALAKHPELSLADVIGSSAVNATGILGVVALIQPIVPVDYAGAVATGVFGIGIYILFATLFSKRNVSPVRGAILLIAYLVFASFSTFL